MTYLTTCHLAEKTGMSASYWRRMCSAGKVPGAFQPSLRLRTWKGWAQNRAQRKGAEMGECQWCYGEDRHEDSCIVPRFDAAKAALQEIADSCPCTCDPAYYERSLVAPDCPADWAGDMAREALGLPIECKGRLAPRTEAQIRQHERLKKILGTKSGTGSLD